MPSSVRTLCRRVFDARKLVAEFPPRFNDPNKRVVHAIACPPGSVPSGQIAFSRWALESLPSTLPEKDDRTKLEATEGYVTYDPPHGGEPALEWHMNFAHSNLFCAYGSPLFAQDEMQVAEHPALGSLREALLCSDLEPLTVEDDEPTPALIRGVERRCQVATGPNAAEGRPHGLYGNHFSMASAEAVARATQAITPPTISNIVAMEAPPGGYGRYTREEIELILRTAFTGFAAARLESFEAGNPAPEVVVHTGFWGCGAYGGHRVLMTMLQLLAARLAELDRLVFHTGDASGAAAYLQGAKTLQELVGSGTRPRKLSTILREIEGLGLEWGESDGN